VVKSEKKIKQTIIWNGYVWILCLEEVFSLEQALRRTALYEERMPLIEEDRHVACLFLTFKQPRESQMNVVMQRVL
jgi:hypothetical protein